MGMLGFFYTLPGFERFIESEVALQTFKWLTVLLLFLAMIGWQTRFAVPVGAFCYFLLGGIIRQYEHFGHSAIVPLYLLAVLAFTPCGDGLSADRLWKVAQGKVVTAADQPSPVYGWSRYACWVVIALVYLSAGLSKLADGGIFWWNATNMRKIVFQDALNPAWWNWNLGLYLLPAPDIVFIMLGITGLFGELGYVTVLFSRVARRIFPIAMMMVHTGIFFLQSVAFFDLILLQLIFFDFTKIRKAVGQRLAVSRGSIQVLYDGFCPFCRRTVRLLDCLDLFERLEFIDFHQLNLSQYNHRQSLDLKRGDLEEEMYVVSQGRAYRGFYGYRVIALALPAFWLLAPWLFLPGITSLGVMVYRYVARNRLKIVKCDSQCTINPSSGSGATVALPVKTPARSFYYPLLVASLTVFLLLSWIYRVEFYPFTAWQLYTKSETSGDVTYYKMLAHHESGVISHAHLDRAIGVMNNGRYRRVLRNCFKPTKVDICQKYLTASGSAYNSKAGPGEKVMQFEIQKWTWNFLSNPSGPEQGNLENRFVYEIKNMTDSK
jgi:predicted DCC family thiol-disulfide oxidoreductase YuxK